MTILTKLFAKNELLLFEQDSRTTATPFEPFVLADLLTGHIEQTKIPMLHFWEAKRTVILGMKDTRVTDLAQGLTLLKKHGYHYLARNSGGLAVVADQGILNLSLIIPNSQEQPLTINQGYEIMLGLIQKAFADFPVEITAKEISDSYCPGDFDLSIDNLKFAGISQRRIRNGIAIMMYLSVSGAQKERGELLRDFYHISLSEQFGQNGYPPVRPSSMANLDQLVQTQLTIADVKNRLLAVFSEDFSGSIKTTTPTAYIKANDLNQAYEKNLAKMVRRNEEIYQIGVE